MSKNFLLKQWYKIFNKSKYRDLKNEKRTTENVKYYNSQIYKQILEIQKKIENNKELSFLHSGQLGDLQYIYSNRLNLGAIRTKENVFWSLAPHDIAIFQYLIGSFPKNVKCKQNKKGRTQYIYIYYCMISNEPEQVRRRAQLMRR